MKNAATAKQWRSQRGWGLGGHKLEQNAPKCHRTWAHNYTRFSNYIGYPGIRKVHRMVWVSFFSVML